MLGKRSRNYIDKEAEKWSRYEEYIAMEGFKIYFVPGDGNCLFRSFTHQIDGDETKFADYLNLAVEYMRLNSAKFLESLRSEEDGTWEEYLAKMEKNKEWGGYLEILALSHALEIQFWFFQENFTTLKIGGPEIDEDGIIINSHFENRPIIYLAYRRSRRHFESALLKEQTETSLSSRVIRKVKKKHDEKANDQTEMELIRKKVIKNKIINGRKDESLKKKVYTKTKIVTEKEKMTEEVSVNFKDVFLLNDKDLVNW